MQAACRGSVSGNVRQSRLQGCGICTTNTRKVKLSIFARCSLVITAAGILGVSVNQALEAYGGYFVKYVAMQGYSKILSALGSTFSEFCRNLNNLHLHLSLSFESMIAPAFRCDKACKYRESYRQCILVSLN